MPLLQVMTERANVLFDREHIATIPLDVFKVDGELTSVLAGLAARLEIACSEQERTYLTSWPVVLQEAVRSILHSAVAVSSRAHSARDRRPVTLAWVPGYDYSVSVWESRATDSSAGAVTLVLSSPYPDDPRRSD